jgi:hypothetical protein
MIDGIAGACASLQSKIASSLGNCCSVGVTTAAGRVAGGVFIFASSLAALRKLHAQQWLSPASGIEATGSRVLLPTHVYASSGVT